MYILEDYKIYVSQYDDSRVEIDIFRNELGTDKRIWTTFTCELLELSDKIKKIIKNNELAEFGYVRFNL